MIQPSCVLRLSTGASSLPASLPDLIRCHPQPYGYRNAADPLRAIALHAQHRLYARQLTGTAMLRPAASPWRRVAHRAGAATTRRRCINISATNSSAEPAFEQRTNIDAAATPVVSPGMRKWCSSA